MAQKNLRADLTNPNVYHSIDENNEEHVYDEIKQKEGYKDPGGTVLCLKHSSGDKKVIPKIFLSGIYLYKYIYIHFGLALLS